MTVELTWRTNRAGDLAAAYLEAAQAAAAVAGLWHLTLVRPEGGGYMGREASLEAAQAAAAVAAGEWVRAAGLCSSGLPAAERTEPVFSAPARRIL